MRKEWKYYWASSRGRAVVEAGRKTFWSHLAVVASETKRGQLKYGIIPKEWWVWGTYT